MLVWFCRFSLPLGVWEGLRFVIMAFPGLFDYLFFLASRTKRVKRQIRRYVFIWHSTANDKLTRISKWKQMSRLNVLFFLDNFIYIFTNMKMEIKK